MMHVSYLTYMHSVSAKIVNPITNTCKIQLFNTFDNAYSFTSFQGVDFLVNFLHSTTS